MQTCEGEEHPNFIMADGRRRPEGFLVVVCRDRRNTTVPMELYVLEHSHFSGLIGWDFMTLCKHRCDCHDNLLRSLWRQQRAWSTNHMNLKQSALTLPTDPMRTKTAWGRFSCRNGYGNVAGTSWTSSLPTKTSNKAP
jgi:hypothetical protein